MKREQFVNRRNVIGGVSFGIALGAAISNAAAGGYYNITDLGSNAPVGINNYGQVIGDTTTPTLASSYTGQAYLWQPTSANATTGSIQLLPTLGGGVEGATGINSMGQITGYSNTSPGTNNFQPFLYTPSAPNSSAGTITPLNGATVPPGGQFQLDGGINDSGEVAFNAGGTSHAALWVPNSPNGTVGTATSLSGALYGAFGINNFGQVTGNLAEYNGTYQAGKFTPTVSGGTTGTYSNIADPGQGGTAYIGPGGGSHINNSGDVAGSGSFNLGGSSHALIWKSNGQVIDLDSQIGGDISYASGINNLGEVVGGSASNNTSYLYFNGTLTNLASLISDPTWSIGNGAVAINDRGQIIGVGHHNGSAATYLLTPANLSPQQWINSGSGDWNNIANWSGGASPNVTVIPNAIGAEADFLGAISSAQTVYTNVPVTAGTLLFNNAKTYVITGAGSLTLQTFTGNALVNVQQGAQEINLPLTIASNTTFNVASGASLQIANPMTINSGHTVTQTGSGSVSYTSTVSVQSGGGIAFGNSTYAHSLSLAPSSTATLLAGTGAHVSVDTLSNSGTVDVQDNSLVVNYGGFFSTPTPAQSIRLQLQSGYNAGAWNGVGIDSTAAHLNHAYAVGYADGADGVVPGLTTGKVLVKYTLYGDLNLDGVVNGTDLTILAANFGKPVSNWDQGDLTYAGVVNGTDFTLLAGNFGKSAGGGSGFASAADWSALSAFAASNGLTTAVPEPTGIVCAGAVAAMVLLRRCRKSQSVLN